MAFKWVSEQRLLYYTQKLKAKLIELIPTKTSDLTNDSNYVSDADYVHTDANFTETEKTKLGTIAFGAEVNVQSDWNQTDTTADDYIKNKPTIPEGVVVDAEMSSTSTNPVQNKVVKAYIDEKASAAYNYKGTITFENIPTSGQHQGDTYNISNAFTTTADFIEGAGKYYPAGTNISWVASANKWDCLAGIIDLSGYVQTSDMVEITTGEIDTIFSTVWT